MVLGQSQHSISVDHLALKLPVLALSGDGPVEPSIAWKRHRDRGIVVRLGGPGPFQPSFSPRRGWCCGLNTGLRRLGLTLEAGIVGGSRIERRLKAPEQSSRKRVVGLELHDPLELVNSRFIVSRRQIMVGQDEPGRGRTWVSPGVILECPELTGVNIDAGIQADQARPVPTGPNGENGIEGGCCFIIALEGEERQGAEFMQRRLVRRLPNCLVDQIKRPGIIA